MPDTSIPSDIREKAERNLRIRSTGVSIFSGCLSGFFWLTVVGAFTSWFFLTPGLRDWFTTFIAYLGTLGQPILDQLATIPGGFPAPLILMFVLSIIFSIFTGIATTVSGFINFKKYDESDKIIDKEAKRLMRNAEEETSTFEKFLDEIQGSISDLDVKAQREFKKFRTWIRMYKDIPDEPEKSKNKVKRDEESQTVRLTDDGELVYDDDSVKQASHSQRS